MKIVTRKAAQKARLVHYFTGKPCKFGHIAKRYTSDSMCVACKRIRRAAYTAERGAEENANRAAYYQAHRDEELARKARYNDAARQARTATENRRRVKKLNALPKWFGEFDQLVETEAFELADQRRELTGIDWAVDHMIPLQAKEASGLHIGCNLQVIPSRLNNSKLNRMILTEPGEWVASL